MRSLWIYIVTMMMLPWVAGAGGRVDFEGEPDSFLLTFTFDSDVAVGVFDAGSRGCASGRAVFDQGTAGQVKLHSVLSHTASTSSATEVAVFTADTDQVYGQSFRSTGGVFKYEVTTAETSGTSTLQIRCSNTQVSSSGGGEVVVSSFEELEGVMRANDQVDAGTYTETDRVHVSVRLSEDFVADPTRTTPYRINLPTGGADHGLVTIDFGNNTMIADALTILELNYGRTDSAGADAPCNNRYEEDVTGCMGVAHDTEVRIRGGFWSSIYDACDGAQTASCGQAAIRTVNADLLYWASGGGFYGTRVSFDNMKCGGQFDSVSEDSAPEPITRAFNLPDDACLELEPGFSQINIGGDQQWEALHALRITAKDVNGGAISTPRITFDTGFNFIQTGPADGDSCIECLGGLMDIESRMAIAGSDLFGVINLNGIQLQGTIGNLRGGNITGHINANWGLRIGVTACYGSGTYPNASTSSPNEDQRQSFFINNSMTPDEAISGNISIAGEMCVAGWVKSAAIETLHIDAILNNDMPGFFASDTTLDSVDRPFILESCHTAEGDCTGMGATVGKIRAAEFSFLSNQSLTTIDMDYDDFFDESVLTGGALNSGGADSFVVADFGVNGFIYAKHASTVQELRDARALPPGSAFPSTASGSVYPSPAGTSMLAGQCRGSYWIATTAGTTFTLPIGENGLNCCFGTDTNNAITIKPTSSTGEKIRSEGVLGTLEKGITNSTASASGDYVCLIAEPGIPTVWRSVGLAGTWTEVP